MYYFQGHFVIGRRLHCPPASSTASRLRNSSIAQPLAQSADAPVDAAVMNNQIIVLN